MDARHSLEFPLLPLRRSGDFVIEDGSPIELHDPEPEAVHLLTTMSTAALSTVEETLLPDGDHGSTPAAVNNTARKRVDSMVTRKAKAASDKEQKMTLVQGLRLYPKAIAWSMLISLCIAMEGFDLCLLNTFYAMPPFRRKYGKELPDGTYQIPAKWQAGLSNGTQCGQILGLVINGWVSERFGYRWTSIVCLVLIAAWTAIYFTAEHIYDILIAGILSGVPWGVFQTLTITYASEVCPVALRGYLTTWVNFCWGLGQIIGNGAVKGTMSYNNEWSYRVPYALQWMWPLPLAIGIYLAPESPWWLVRKGRLDDAKRSLIRLTSVNRDTDFDPDATVAMIAHTTALEEQITAGATYLDCFRGVDLRRTEIVCMIWAIQNLSGNSFSGYSTYFLVQAGLNPKHALSFTLGKNAINMIGVFGAWTLMSFGIGRRSLYLYGLCGLWTMLMILGFLGIPSDRKAASLATGSISLLWALCYQLTVGTVCYSLVAEMSSRRLQIKTVALGRACYNVVAIVNNVLTPYMLNPAEWNWGNYAAFFWAGACFLSIIYTYFRVPEPAGRSFAEMDLLFEHKVSARKFKTTHVDVFEEDVKGRAVQDLESTLNSSSQNEADPAHHAAPKGSVLV
ncbi:hypothetical protein DV738_g4912, partial [Chaetothyriales sp. CBS 135597]